MFQEFFSSEAVLFQLMLLLEKRHVFAQTIKLYPPTGLRVKTDLRLRTVVPFNVERQFFLRFQCDLDYVGL